MTGPKRQHGYTLLLTLLVLLVGGASLFVAARDPGAARAAIDAQQTALDLREAKRAVIAYSIDDPERPGSLPCPDADGDGRSELLSGSDCPSYAAWLPWRTFDVPDEGSSLLFIMDAGFRDHDDVDPLNVATGGALSLNGAPGFAALIIDPGDPLAGQSGRPSNNLSDYLDVAENTNGDDVFVDCAGIAGCNDRVVGVAADELFERVQRRALVKTRLVLEDFYFSKGYFPYASEFSSPGPSCDSGTHRGRIPMHDGDCGPGESLSTLGFDARDAQWVLTYDWNEHIVYVVDNDCTAGGSCTAPGLTLTADNGLAVVLGAAGTEIAALGQDRGTPGTRTIDDYLDSAENTDGNDVFDDLPLAENEDNDLMLGFAP